MTIVQPDSSGWILISVAPEQEKEAQQLRARRDQLYRNIYREKSTDMRWLGELAEMVFDQWITTEGLNGYEWIVDRPVGQPDFILPNNCRVGIKAVKRKAPPRKDYTAQITASHRDEPVDQFFFMTYVPNQRRMWLFGGIERARFVNEAKYFGPGEWVHPYYQVAADHEILNIETTKLVLPKAWLRDVGSIRGKV